jgi:hypothetical protein
MDLFMTSVKQQLVKAVLGVALVCAFALPAAAQDMKIGVVSLPALIERAPQTKAAMDALQEEFAPRQREFQAKQKEYEDQATKAQKDLAVMGETERRNMEKEAQGSSGICPGARLRPDCWRRCAVCECRCKHYRRCVACC